MVQGIATIGPNVPRKDLKISLCFRRGLHRQRFGCSVMVVLKAIPPLLLLIPVPRCFLYNEDYIKAPVLAA